METRNSGIKSNRTANKLVPKATKNRHYYRGRLQTVVVEMFGFIYHLISFFLLQMMKHVQLSPYRSRADTVSLSSTVSYSSASPEPLGSRSSSYSSLSEAAPQVRNF